MARKNKRAQRLEEAFMREEELGRRQEEDEEMTDSDNMGSVSSTEDQKPIPQTDEQYLAQMPDQQDIKNAREAIATRQKRLAELEERRKLAENEFEAIREKRRALEHDITRNQELLSKLRIMPNEMLSAVFTAYIESDLDASPWILASVNRAWRAAALTTPSLWRKITLVGNGWQSACVSRTLRGSELCCTGEQLKRALKRAGVGPLEVTILLENAPKTQQRARTIANQIEILLAILREEGFMQRISTLRFEGKIGFVSSYLGSVAWEMPKLQNLVAEHGSIVGTKKMFDTSELRSVRIHNTYWSMSDMPPARSSKLKELSLSGPKFMNDMDWKALGARIQSYSLLTHLEIRGPGTCWSNSSVLALPRLTYLEIEHCKSWPIVVPNLQTLIITKGEFADGPPGSNQFPTVKVFRMDTQKYHWGNDIENYQLRSIQTLDLRCMASVTTNNSHFKLLEKNQLTTKLMKPVVIRLRDMLVHEKILLDTLEAIPTLETLELTGCLVGKVFFAGLAPKKATATIPYPSLTTVKVDFSSKKLKEDPKSIKATAKRAMKARVLAGRDMLWALLKVTEEAGWSDLLN